MTTLPWAVYWLLRLSTPWCVADVQRLTGCGMAYTDHAITGYLSRLVRQQVIAQTAPGWYVAGDQAACRRFRWQVKNGQQNARGNNRLYQIAKNHRRELLRRDEDERRSALSGAVSAL